MVFLIETLLGGGEVKRQDTKRLTLGKRPPPSRPRDFFELIALMGATATIEGLLRGIETKGSDPRVMSAAILGRWPTAAEMAEIQTPYNANLHIRNLIRTREFRAPILRRLFEAYPERQRLLFVRIPRCAGVGIMDVLRQKHPVMQLDLEDRRYRDPTVLLPVLGQLMASFGTTRTLAVEQSNIAPFLEPPATKVPGSDPLHWHLPQPPCRAQDLLFGIIRPPQDIILSQVNGVLTALRSPAADENTMVATLRSQLPALPRASSQSEWKQIGRGVLRGLRMSNPICTALGDGTAAGALAQCTRSPIQLVPLENYTQWARSAFDCAPPPPVNVSTPILIPGDLSSEDTAHLAALVAEDKIFHAHFEERRNILKNSYVTGFDL